MNKQILVSALGAMLLASCADHFDQNFETVRPDKEAQYGYLEQYDALKEYIKDRPNFHLGIGTTVDEYNKKELVYALTNSNFNETVAGNAMKMSSCVADDGSMNFDKVSEYVKNATDAGLSVYGHTLAWHSQQPNKYLKRLIADKELPPSSNVTRCLVIKNNKAGGHWDAQLYFPAQLSQGKKYVFTMNAKATAPFDLILWGAPGDAGLGSISVGTQWNEYTVEFTPTANYENFVFAAGKLGGELDIKSLSLCEEGSTNNLIVNGDIKEDEVPCNKPYSWHTVTSEIQEVAESQVVEIPVSVGHLTFDDGQNLGGWGMDNKPKIVNGVCEVGNNAAKKNPWDAQVNYEPGFTFENGTTYHLKMKIKGSVAGEFGAGFQNPDGYKGCGDFPTIKVTTDWKEVDVTTTCNGDNALRLLLNIGKYAGTLYIDDFEVYYTKSSNGIPLTPQEKSDTLTWAMNKWISGMMQATEGKVKAWDLINEAVSGGGNVNGFYALQTEATSEHNPQDFYWQDYFTPEMYGPIVEKAARDAYAAVEGTNPEDLKLFINDYNLESDWDDNKKVKSLKYWIEVWEKKGKELGWNTKIDGIGSQMHISYYENPQTLESKKKAIQNMLKIMAETGKLVRISEIDMGYVDKDGKDVTTAQLEKLPIEERVAKEKAMAEHYKWIIEQYFKIVPVSQQYGICQWCLTDSPTDSGWRPGQPVGLWNLNYQRKPAYGGFADGLASSAKGESDVK